MKKIICPECECDDIKIESSGNGIINCLCYECGTEFSVEGDIEEIEMIDIEELFNLKENTINRGGN